MPFCSVVSLDKHLRPLWYHILLSQNTGKDIETTSKKASNSWGWGHKTAGPSYYTNSIESHPPLEEAYKSLSHTRSTTDLRQKFKCHGGEGTGTLRSSQAQDPGAQVDIRPRLSQTKERLPTSSLASPEQQAEAMFMNTAAEESRDRSTKTLPTPSPTLKVPQKECEV